MVTCTHPVITCLNKYPAYNGVSGRERSAKGTNATLLVLSNSTMLRPARRKEIGLIDQE